MNRLADETSPYLRQHAGQPGRLVPLGRRGLRPGQGGGQAHPALRRLLGLPLVPRHGPRVLRGRGHRRGHERLFVNIKVDREERPDVDAVYMEAVQAIDRQGGWPMTVFLTARRPPVLRRHLLPPGPLRRAAPPGGRGVDRAAPGDSRATPTSWPRPSGPGRPPGAAAGGRADGSPRRRRCSTAATRPSRTAYDPEWGGFGRAPKFPQPSHAGAGAAAGRPGGRHRRPGHG